MDRHGSDRMRGFVHFLVVLLFGTALFGCGGGGGSSPGSSTLPPIATTQAATGITTSGAVLNGAVNPNGMATDAWFQYGTDPNLSGADNTAIQAAGNGVADVSVNASVTGLTAGTTWYFRVCASSAAGTVYGSTVSFATGSPGAAPTVQTLAASGVGTDNARLSGSVNPNGQATQAWFEWGTDPGLAGSSSTSTQSGGSGSSAVVLGASLAGLSSDTTYYYRVVASNATGTSYGLIVSFATSPASVPPTVTTLGATGIGQDNAALNGQVNPNGLSTTAHFEWGLDSLLAGADNTPSQGIGSGASNVAVAAGLTGLTDNTTYYYRAVGTNSAGTSKGVIGSFTTALAVVPPTVTTTAASDIGADNAVLNGSVDPNGLATTVWFRYGTDPGLAGATTTSAQSAGSGDSEVPVFAQITGLADNTTYYFRLEAQSAAGTVTGTILDFRNDCFVNGTVDAKSTYLFFDRNNEPRGTVTNSGGTATSFSLTLPASSYKFVCITSLDNTDERAWTVQDAGGNNVFLLEGGAALDLGGLVSSSDADGTRTIDITGTGYTASRTAPIGVVGEWDTSATITASNDPGYVVGNTYTFVDNIVSQSANRIDTYDVSYAMSFAGTINGDLIVYSYTFYIVSWKIHYREFSTVNAAGDRFTGTNEQTGVLEPDSRLVAADLVSVKRP